MLIALSYLRRFIIFVNARPEIIVVGLVSFLGSEARPYSLFPCRLFRVDLLYYCNYC